MTSLETWQDKSLSRPERMRAFERWVFSEIYDILWKMRAVEMDRLKFAGQLRKQTFRMIAKMAQVGCFLNGSDLENMVRKAVFAPLEQARDEKVSEPYPYMQTVFSRLLERWSDEIKETSMRAGTHISQLMGKIQTDHSMTDIVAEYQLVIDERKEYEILKQRKREEGDQRQLKLGI